MPFLLKSLSASMLVRHLSYQSIATRVLPVSNFSWKSQSMVCVISVNKITMRSIVKVIKTPPMAESIQEGTLTTWHKKVGEYVERDEPIATIETDKIDVTVNSPESGTVAECFAQEGDTVQVGSNMFSVELDGKPSAASATTEAPVPNPKIEAPKAAIPEPTPITKPTANVSKPIETAPKPAEISKPTHLAKKEVVKVENELSGIVPGERTERRVKMTRMRLKIAERLKASQNTAASLTTFNEIDMSALIQMRNQYKEEILEKHGVKFGFMSPFIKAASLALQAIPEVNARIEGDHIVYNDFVDISVAVATPKGLVTPVLRNCESLSMLETEKALAALSKKARSNEISIEDMAGGTFTISNGGVFGSLMGTPIINQPQSAILGMHATKDRAVVVNGQVVVRPMMYIALTYDHRLVDGREATTFLVKIKQLIEDPRRMLLDI